ncbi:TPA: DUF1329 domain-containing protein [Pseudomonas aeruginosa]
MNVLFKYAAFALAFGLATSAAATELAAGTRIDKSNLDKVLGDTFEGKPLKELLTEKVQWQIRNYNLGLTLAASKPVALDPAYLKASADNAGKVTFDKATRTVKGWEKGVPFPQIDEKDPDAGDKIVWNFIYGRPMGDSQELKNFHYILIDAKTGVERVQRYRLDRFYTRGRLNGPASIGDDFMLQNTLLFAEAPQDIKGIGTYTKRYADGFKIDDVWAYVKSVRRVRRISGNAWMDPVGGLDILGDDIDVWDSPPNWYKSIKLVGKRWILAVTDTPNTVGSEGQDPAAQFPWLDVSTAPYWNPNPKLGWQPREVWVLEGTPPDAHPYGKKILYVDVQANRPLMSEIYDKNGEFWRFHHMQQQSITGEDGYKAILPVQGEQIDFKRQHATNFVSTYVVNRKGAKESDFSLGKLEAAGK